MSITGRLKPDSLLPIPGRAGYTLLELALVVGLMGILVGIAVPSVNQLLGRQQEMIVIGDIENWLLGIRQQAITESQPWWIRWSIDDSSLISGRLNEPVSQYLIIDDSFRFGFCEQSEKLDSDQLGNFPESAMEINWSPEFWFQPDGSADNISWELTTETQKRFLVEIRGLTGQVEISQQEPAE